MALDNENGMVMPVAPMGYGGYGGYGGGFGNGFGFGGDGAWIILFLIAMMGGWGNGFGGGWGGGFGGMFEFPWLLNGQNGINQNTDAAINQLTTTTALGNIQNAITTGFSSAEVGACNRALDALNRSFDSQTAITAGQTALQSQLAQCCCDNRLATANLSALVQSENCADREALSNGIRDIISSQTAGVQRILDTLCQDKIDAKNERIQELQTQVTMQNLAASQAAQTAQLMADNTAQTQALINRIAPYPQPSFIVGNPYGYGGYYGYNTGCGCNNGFGLTA